MKDTKFDHPKILASSKNLPTLKTYLDDENISKQANRNLSHNQTNTNLVADDKLKLLQNEMINGNFSVGQSLEE